METQIAARERALLGSCTRPGAQHVPVRPGLFCFRKAGPARDVVRRECAWAGKVAQFQRHATGRCPRKCSTWRDFSLARFFGMQRAAKRRQRGTRPALAKGAGVGQAALCVRFQNLLPSEELVSFARDLWRGLGGETAFYAEGPTISIAHQAEGICARFRAEVFIPSPVPLRAHAYGADPFAAVTTAFVNATAGLNAA